MVPIDYIFNRASGCKVVSIFNKFTKESGGIMKARKPQEKDDELKAMGGLCIKPKYKGLVKNIVCLDFSSMYPNTMKSQNLSHDTLIKDDGLKEILNKKGIKYTKHEYFKTRELTKDEKAIKKKELYEKYKDSLFGDLSEKKVSYKMMNELIPAEYDENGVGVKKPLETTLESNYCYFVDSESYKGIFSKYLTYLMDERKKSKNAMKIAYKNNNMFEYELYNAIQQAYKVLCNAGYGVTLSTTSSMYCEEIGGCTTARSRGYLSQTKDYVENIARIKGEVIYGDTDSVMVRFDDLRKYYDDIKNEKDYHIKLVSYSREITKAINNYYNWYPTELEFEKIFYKAIFEKEKKYDALAYVDGTNLLDFGNPKNVYMGNDMKRKDSYEIMKKILTDINNGIFSEKSNEFILNQLEETLESILNHKYPMETFKKGMTIKDLKSYEGKNKNGKEKTEPLHVKVAKDKSNRLNQEIEPNEKIYFLYMIDPADVNNKTKSDLAIDYDFARDKKVMVNYALYLELFTDKISKQQCGLDEKEDKNLSNILAKSKQHFASNLSNNVDNTKETITKEN
jgi:DNA polymerase elongation subunit (family B)